MSDLKRFPLTEEQQAICDTCLPPPNLDKKCPEDQEDSENECFSISPQTIRVTAAAGAGKTTVLLELALTAIQQGHEEIAYVTFSKAAARDGKQRLTRALGTSSGKSHKKCPALYATTLHASAQSALKQYYRRQIEISDEDTEMLQEASNFMNSNILSDKKLQEWISKELDQEIEDFLRLCYDHIENHTPRLRGHSHDDHVAAIARRKTKARRKVEELLYKTLIKQFCNLGMSLEKFQDNSTRMRRYHLAEKFHVPDKPTKKTPDPEYSGKKFGFVHEQYKEKFFCANWYADQAAELFQRSLQQGIRSFALEVKRAQLLKLPIPGTLLLVDEAQDMDQCQMQWVTGQKNAHVYIVGDAAQSIYGFRGARSRYLMDMSPTKDLTLTASWRFGKKIAAIANVALFAKSHSAQSRPKHEYDAENSCPKGWKYKYWIPYRVTVGDVSKTSQVVADSILDDWKSHGQVTVLAMTNAGLLKVISEKFLSDENLAHFVEDFQTGSDVDGSRECLEESEDESMNDHNELGVVEEPPLEENLHFLPKKHFNRYPKHLPKFHINGGAKAGRATFKKAFRQVEVLYELYSDKDQTKKLPKEIFPDFEDAVVSWSSFCEECKEFEYNQYNVAIGIIVKLQNDTMNVVEKFNNYVLATNWTKEEANIVLSTTHSAKGMEWDNVEVADDFPDLAEFKADGSRYVQLSENRWKKVKQNCWQFAISEFGDHINLLYVAVTRAKKLLSIPPSIVDVLNDFDKLYKWILEHEDNPKGSLYYPPSLRSTKLGLPDVPNFHEDLILPFRCEHGLPNGVMALDTLVQKEIHSDEAVGKNQANSAAVVTPERIPKVLPQRVNIFGRRQLFSICKNSKPPAKKRKAKPPPQAAAKKSQEQNDGETPGKKQKKLTDFFSKR